METCRQRITAFLRSDRVFESLRQWQTYLIYVKRKHVVFIKQWMQEYSRAVQDRLKGGWSLSRGNEILHERAGKENDLYALSLSSWCSSLEVLNQGLCGEVSDLYRQLTH